MYYKINYSYKFTAHAIKLDEQRAAYSPYHVKELTNTLRHTRSIRRQSACVGAGGETETARAGGDEPCLQDNTFYVTMAIVWLPINVHLVPFNIVTMERNSNIIFSLKLRAWRLRMYACWHRLHLQFNMLEITSIRTLLIFMYLLCLWYINLFAWMIIVCISTTKDDI